MSLRIGRIEYANCTPIFTVLLEGFDCGGYSFVKGVPANLNRMLFQGEIDICPSSSIEYGRSFERYLLLPDLSISSYGPVKSVLLFSLLPIEKLDGETVGLTVDSSTSSNLLKIILKRYYGFTNIFRAVPQPDGELTAECPAMLLIGDQALRRAMKKRERYVYDLGELWFRCTGLPFVFALWIAREDAVGKKGDEMAVLAENLLKAKKLASDSFERIAGRCAEAGWMGIEALVDYWKTISYDLTPKHKEGLVLFFHHAAELGIIKREPELRFLEK